MGRHACFLAVCISSAWTVSASSQDGVLTLDSGWSMQSSVECGGLDGKAISSPGLDTSRWYTLSKFPATVLAGLQQSGEYPDLFYAQNLKLVISYGCIYKLGVTGFTETGECFSV
eukprot:m.84641 g.84641  ORF g.84641 m.84641 type:complete len:115 (-) comp12975_c0_seq1:1405-1749(-)